ncbi:DUF397 domain-containing protein [Pseudonocardia humida]|uniref:DUF397 domain-containing protein n=1 Tax=Pseudonocardia humida TaxID=2800819 RepID=A0ABT1A353_9PSEU|nr:DUF397 domain-containing protein [Pseudonocardia humida]MCO1657381.1 DUF397 domain-containing protein [Pseudonocardia humida]
MDADQTWFKSSFSGGNEGSCVEVAFLPGDGVAVRDTKDRTRAPHRYTAGAWTAFLAATRAGEFDHR